RRAAAARREDPDGNRADAVAAAARHQPAPARAARRAEPGRRRRAQPALAMHATAPLLRRHRFPALARAKLETLQVNLGYRCNQSCVHCHVNAGPSRTEMMPASVIEDVVAFL